MAMVKGAVPGGPDNAGMASAYPLPGPEPPGNWRAGTVTWS